MLMMQANLTHFRMVSLLGRGPQPDGHRLSVREAGNHEQRTQLSSMRQATWGLQRKTGSRKFFVYLKQSMTLAGVGDW